MSLESLILTLLTMENISYDIKDLIWSKLDNKLKGSSNIESIFRKKRPNFTLK